MCNMAVQDVPAEAAPDHECLEEISGATAEDDAEPTVLLLEEYLEGKFIKWNNNKSQVRRKNDAIPQVLLPYKAETVSAHIAETLLHGHKAGDQRDKLDKCVCFSLDCILCCNGHQRASKEVCPLNVRLRTTSAKI